MIDDSTVNTPNIELLLSNFTQVTQKVYLRSDNKVLAICKDATQIGFITIEAYSKKNFDCSGMILKDKALETIILGKNPNGTARYNPFADVKRFVIPEDQKSSKLTIMPASIDRYVAQYDESSHQELLQEMKNLTEVVCKDYAIDTTSNKLRNAWSGAVLKYSPSKREMRAKLKKQLHDQIPKLITQIHAAIDQIKSQYQYYEGQLKDNKEFRDKTCEIENLLGVKFETIINNSLEELYKLAPQIKSNMFKNIKYTSERNKAHYVITSVIDTYTSPIGLTNFKRNTARSEYILNSSKKGNTCRV
jgi:hypothetical protein